MAFLDSSAIIDYLDGVTHVVEFVDDQSHLLTSSICVYEVLHGEVLSSGKSDVMGARQKFGRVEALDFNETIAVEAARMQDRLAATGETMPVRDILIAASARSTGDTLVVGDGDFDVATLEQMMQIHDLRSPS